ncbi:MAG: 4Fe-4S binding protein [Deltaproteobacteria bacterium]|nr:4Fe-4S binding protein [Deltaproteobacteria bacterium]
MAIYIAGEFCKGCGLCIYYCPTDVLEFSGTRTKKGYALPEVVHPDNCKQCKLCELHCPDCAIYVESTDPTE